MITTAKQQQRERNKEVTARIHKLLTEDPRYRDDDNLLMNRVQRDEILSMGLQIESVSVKDFFRYRLDNKITDEDTITRLRRLVQEKYPETRGEKYKKRQSKQLEVQDDIRDIESDDTTGRMDINEDWLPNYELLTNEAPYSSSGQKNQ